MKLSPAKLFLTGLLALSVIGVGLSDCGKKNNGPSVDIPTSVATATDALSSQDPLSAKAACADVLKVKPDNCSCQWIYALADVQDLAQTEIQVIIDNLELGMLQDNLGMLFTGVSMDLADIPTRTANIEANACEFTLSTLPVTIKLDLSSLQSLASVLPSSVSGLFTSMPTNVTVQLAFGSQWGPAEAKVMGSSANSMLAFINLLSAHDPDVMGLMGVNFSSIDMSEPIGLLRSLDSIFISAPTFLAFNQQGTGATDVTNAGKEINASLKEINGLNESLQLDAGNPNKVLSYNDVNGDGIVDGGDTFTLGALYYTNSTWVNIVQELTGGDTITVPSEITDKVQPAISALLTEFTDNLTNGTPDIVPTDLNNLIEAFGMTPAVFQTNVISLNPSAFFANPEPLRYFLPTTANGQFQVEAEITDTTGMPWYYEQGDSMHFTDGTSPIYNDGITVPMTAEGILFQSPILPYISFNDPTFGGVLSIDLSQMLLFCESSAAEGSFTGTTCPEATPVGFQPADNYRLDKIMAGGLYGLYYNTATGQPFTTVNPIK